MTSERPTAALVLTLVAGIWILAMALAWWGWGPQGGPQGMMGGGWMRGASLMWSGAWTPWVGALAGLLVLGGAVGGYLRPPSAPAWGIVIVVAAAVNLVAGLGGFLASALGIVGGTLMALHSAGPD